MQIAVLNVALNVVETVQLRIIRARKGIVVVAEKLVVAEGF